MVDHTLEPAQARGSGYDRGVDGRVAGGRLGPGGYGLTSWTSWTTSHSALRGRRKTLLVDVDDGRKATSHKGVKQQQCGPRSSLPLRNLPSLATHGAVTYADRRFCTPPGGPWSRRPRAPRGDGFRDPDTSGRTTPLPKPPSPRPGDRARVLCHGRERQAAGRRGTSGMPGWWTSRSNAEAWGEPDLSR